MGKCGEKKCKCDKCQKRREEKKCKEEEVGKTHHVIIPGADRFTPFSLTIWQGDKVVWTNNDTDDHILASDDAVNSAGPK